MTAVCDTFRGALCAHGLDDRRLDDAVADGALVATRGWQDSTRQPARARGTLRQSRSATDDTLLENAIGFGQSEVRSEVRS